MSVNAQDKLQKFGTAVILAGGRSSRMGFNKQFLELAGQRLLAKQIKLLKSIFSDVLLVTNTPEDFAGVRILKDEFAGKGPLAGIHVALKNAKSQYVYVVACDMPNLDIDGIKLMQNLLKDEDAVLFEGEPLNAFYSMNLIAKLEQAILSDKLSANRFVGELAKVLVLTGGIKQINLNTPEDLKRF